MLNPGLAEGVRRIGFRKWYERELLSSHAHMILCVLATIGLLGSFEAMRGANRDEIYLNVLFVFACAGIGVWALRRYLKLLSHAEIVANQASCGSCGEYGRFTVVNSDLRLGATEVACKRCAHHWTISSDY
jgi:predicted Zn finger-like uncharacterized protein